jgi:hypothetical protein
MYLSDIYKELWQNLITQNWFLISGALLPNTFSKLPAKKTSGARHAFGSNSSGLFAPDQQIACGPSRAMFLENVLW